LAPASKSGLLVIRRIRSLAAKPWDALPSRARVAHARATDFTVGEAKNVFIVAGKQGWLIRLDTAN